MAAAFESSDLEPASASAATIRAAGLRAVLVSLWPPTLIGLGVVLTLAWIGSLAWFLVRLILALV